MQNISNKYVKTCVKYAEIVTNKYQYANICNKICRDMQFICSYMCLKCKNMQKICKHMHEYVNRNMQIYAINMHV